MAITNGYCTLAEFKGHVIASGDDDFTTTDVTNIELAIEATSRWLDSYFNTSFYERTETRYYTAEFTDLLYVDDLLTITTLKTDDDANGTYETTWTTSDYWLEPRNAQSRSEPRPYRQIRVNQNGDYSFPTGEPYLVEIAGTWGYCTSANLPPPIKQFTLLYAHRLWKRKDSIFGIAGTPALGVQVIQAKVQQDSDLMMLLKDIDKRGFYA